MFKLQGALLQLVGHLLLFLFIGQSSPLLSLPDKVADQAKQQQGHDTGCDPDARACPEHRFAEIFLSERRKFHRDHITGDDVVEFLTHLTETSTQGRGALDDLKGWLNFVNSAGCVLSLNFSPHRMRGKQDGIDIAIKQRFQQDAAPVHHMQIQTALSFGKRPRCIGYLDPDPARAEAGQVRQTCGFARACENREVVPLDRQREVHDLPACIVDAYLCQHVIGLGRWSEPEFVVADGLEPDIQLRALRQVAHDVDVEARDCPVVIVRAVGRKVGHSDRQHFRFCWRYRQKPLAAKPVQFAAVPHLGDGLIDARHQIGAAFMDGENPIKGPHDLADRGDPVIQLDRMCRRHQAFLRDHDTVDPSTQEMDQQSAVIRQVDLLIALQQRRAF